MHWPWDGNLKSSQSHSGLQNWRQTKLNCFRELCVCWLFETKTCWTFVTTFHVQVGLCKASCVSRAVQDARWQLNSLTFALSSLIFAALNTELLPLNEAMCQSRSCRSCGAWEAMHWSWLCGLLRSYLNLSRTVHSLFMPTVSVPLKSDWSFFAWWFEKYPRVRRLMEDPFVYTMYNAQYTQLKIDIYYSRCHWGSVILVAALCQFKQSLSISLSLSRKGFVPVFLDVKM